MRDGAHDACSREDAGMTKIVEQISKLQLQLKILQDDEMQDAKTIQNLSKMAARFRKGLDQIYELHNSGDEYSEREINDKTYEIVVYALAGYK